MAKELNKDLVCGTVLDYFGTSSILIFHIANMDNNILEVEFTDPIYLVDKFSDEIVKLWHESAKSEKFLTVVRRQYMELPAEHPYKHYQFLNQKNEPCFEIIASAALCSLKE